MKSKDLNYGVLYVEGRDRSVAYVLDTDRVYGPRGGHVGPKYYHDRYAKQEKPTFQTHMLVLRPTGWYGGAPEDGASYTVEDYERGVTPPHGWQVGIATSAQFVATVADYSAQQEHARLAREAGQAARVARHLKSEAEYESIRKAMAHNGVTAPTHADHSRQTITLSFEQARRIMGLV